MHRIRSALSSTSLPAFEENDGANNADRPNIAPIRPSRHATNEPTHQRPPTTMRLRRLMRPHLTIGNTFNNKTPNQKIDWLLRAAGELREGDHPHLNQISVGTRRLSKKEAFCFALEIGIESQRPRVPELCDQLLQTYDANSIRYNLFGVPFSRTNIANWAHEILINDEPIAWPKMLDLGISLYQGSRQNCFLPAVLIAFDDQLGVIAARVPAEQRISALAAEQEIRTYLQRARSPESAMTGFNMVRTRTVQIINFDASVRAAMVTLWNYIRLIPDENLREQLQKSMEKKFREINRERPCATGMIERLIDIPTAIDWSITQGISLESLRYELETLAATVHNEFEAENQDYTTIVRSEAGEDHVTADADELTTMLKRERFLQTADVEFCRIRGIDRAIVKREAEKKFPANLVL